MARTVLRGRDGGNVVLLPDYLKEYTSVRELEAGLDHYFQFYNHDRPHQSLQYRTPAEVYFV
jgi:transposase InsO family protein